MVGYLARYQQGECEQVWRELTELGEDVRNEPVYSEALAVAHEMMSRVRSNIELIITRLQAIGYRFGYGWMSTDTIQQIAQEPPLLATPTDENITRLQQLEQAGIFLPIALQAFYQVVGAVNFVGVATAAMDRFEYGDDAIDEEADEDMVDEELDPLYILPLEETLTPEAFFYWQEQEEGPYPLVITYGAARKFFLHDEHGTGSSFIELPCRSVDASLINENGTGITFVEYLRWQLYRGGLPGTSEFPGLGEKALAYVTEDLLPF